MIALASNPDARRIRLESDDYFRGIGMLALGGVLLFVILPLALLGWLGVIEMTGGAVGAFATLVTILLGTIALRLGLFQRYGWAELVFEPDAIVVAHGVSGRTRRTERIERLSAAIPLTAIVGDLDLGRGNVEHYLEVFTEARRSPVEIAKRLRVSKQRLAEVAAIVESWGRG